MVVAMGLCDAEPEANPVASPDAEADPWHAYGYYGHYPSYYRRGYYGWGYPYRYGYWGRKKREAEAEPTAAADADPEADPHYGYYGYYPYYRGYYGHGYWPRRYWW